VRDTGDGEISIRWARLELTREHGLPAEATVFADPGVRRGGTPAKRDQRIASEASLCRHRKRLPDSRGALRAPARAHCRRARRRVARVPERLLHPRHGQRAHADPAHRADPGEKPAAFIGPRNCLHCDRVTCWDGGFIPEDEKGTDHHGAGFNHVALVTANGLPLAVEVERFQVSEIRG
jgi:hypothetical protein